MEKYYFYYDGFYTEVSKEELLDFRDYISMKYEIFQWYSSGNSILHLSYKISSSIIIEFGVISDKEL